jgi:lipoprotein-anchoring transpeptidase ErfK/SrfK
MGIDDKINDKPNQEKAESHSNPDQEKINGKLSPDQIIPDHDIVSDQSDLIQKQSDLEQDGDRNELLQILSLYWSRIYSNLLLRKIITGISYFGLIIFILFFIFSWFVFLVPGFQEIIGSGRKFQSSKSTEIINDQSYKKQIAQMGKDFQKLSRKFTAYTPGQSYIVINTTDNRFFLYRNKKLIREGFCSTGSYTRLTNAEGSRHWIFKTPKGRFWIQQKITSPLWVRPDWSFVEEGLPIPPPNDESRYEYGVLGDYAMSLGDGYLIHGTLYKRFLGMPVTHGCVRLGDADLEAIYNTLNIGSKVFIF